MGRSSAGLATGLEVAGGGATGLSVTGRVEQLESQAPGQASFAVNPSLFSKKQRLAGFSATYSHVWAVLNLPLQKRSLSHPEVGGVGVGGEGEGGGGAGVPPPPSSTFETHPNTSILAPSISAPPALCCPPWTA